MKLFVWEDVLHYNEPGESSGIAFAFAENKEQALEVIKKSCKYYGECAYNECKDLEPKIFTTPIGFFKCGSGY